MGTAFFFFDETGVVYFHAGIRHLIYRNRNLFRDKVFFFLFVIYNASVKSEVVCLLSVKLYSLFHALFNVVFYVV
jgi:hypothetical protein